MAPRGYGTPLFPINHTEAILRDHTGRLRRQSWLASKLRRYLKRKMGHASLSEITIERAANKVKINIFSARPGIVIG